LNFSKKEKIDLLKAFTKIMKDSIGRGPRNIYIKYFDDEIHVVVEGIISDFEKHLIRTFNEEAIDTLTNFYERYAKKCDNILIKLLDGKYYFKFYKLESDFIKDKFIYKMKIKDSFDSRKTEIC